MEDESFTSPFLTKTSERYSPGPTILFTERYNKEEENMYVKSPGNIKYLMICYNISRLIQFLGFLYLLINYYYYKKNLDQNAVVLVKNNRSKDVMGNLFKKIFLPRGYPHSVSPDYTNYQIWDTAQAFCSTFTGKFVF